MRALPRHRCNTWTLMPDSPGLRLIGVLDPNDDSPPLCPGPSGLDPGYGVGSLWGPRGSWGSWQYTKAGNARSGGRMMWANVTNLMCLSTS